MRKNMGNKKRKGGKIILAIIILAVLCLAGYNAAKYFEKHRKSVIGKSTLYIRPGTDFQTLMDTLSGRLSHLKSFIKVAEKEQLPSQIHPGRYVIDSTMSNIQLVRNLKYGYQSPLMVSINGRIRTPKQLAAKLGKRLCADSAEFMEAFRDVNFLKELETDTSNMLSLIIPESYEFYWTVTPKEFLQRMKKERDKFWTPERIQKARELKLTPNQVSVLASIVYGESNYVPEYPKIASVYLNRLNKGWKLCADPTVVYATGDFTLKRVLKKHLETDSPYNTYKVYGLPPGPIMIPTKECIDGVLNADKTDYYYFCASPSFNGTHRFARTDREHFANAAAYRKGYDSLMRAKAKANGV